ncbi:MAG: UDP-N-acetylglucosamine 2-epimerase (non-hydrolyzing) [Planctomycetes bacterium]|nr:UDP-N-acetylglucosamine 2-epimerase (non-hydrolyzing) [Planctomycetota bacterium]
MRVLTVVGARPQFIKAAIVGRALRERGGIEERLVHTGQHYDRQMSDVFFEELEIPHPAHSLGIGSCSHGQQTGRMLERLDDVLDAEVPDCVLLYGDTNSTLAGALAAVKRHVPVAHVEAGLRSFDLKMPEEVNRVLTDRVSRWLFCPTQTAVENLAAEGLRQGVFLVGDVMYDSAVYFAGVAEAKVDPFARLGLVRKQYVLVTCHRAANTDDPSRLSSIVRAAQSIARRIPVLLPLHPRTRQAVAGAGLSWGTDVRICEPLSYLEMLSLERQAAAVLTDSGGVQKEAFFFGVPCVTMRSETEWTETLLERANVLVDADEMRITAAVFEQLDRRTPLPDAAAHYGGGRASARIAEMLANG